MILMMACQEKSTEIQIFHLEKDAVYPNKVIIEGEIVNQGEHKEAFFALKNFDLQQKEELKQLNILVKESLKVSSFRDYQLFTIRFYLYGGEINEQTTHSSGTDSDNETFNVQKLRAVYSWEKGIFLDAKFYENGDVKKVILEL